MQHQHRLGTKDVEAFAVVAGHPELRKASASEPVWQALTHETLHKINNGHQFASFCLSAHSDRQQKSIRASESGSSSAAALIIA